ncbi:MAG TPA: SDR family NAD(P)-dependent oxidoreductase, partial [Thermoanaerobaculia bacterium]|nr:SDR family NAD(P)-dependent oxidoreductase [Thermoanaerobaculia bacterium]
MTRTLITGATSGIGAALAESLAATHELILHGRDEPRLRAVRARCARSERHALWT